MSATTSMPNDAWYFDKLSKQPTMTMGTNSFPSVGTVDYRIANAESVKRPWVEIANGVELSPSLSELMTKIISIKEYPVVIAGGSAIELYRRRSFDGARDFDLYVPKSHMLEFETTLLSLGYVCHVTSDVDNSYGIMVRKYGPGGPASFQCEPITWKEFYATKSSKKKSYPTGVDLPYKPTAYRAATLSTEWLKKFDFSNVTMPELPPAITVGITPPCAAHVLPHYEKFDLSYPNTIDVIYVDDDHIQDDGCIEERDEDDEESEDDSIDLEEDEEDDDLDFDNVALRFIRREFDLSVCKTAIVNVRTRKDGVTVGDVITLYPKAHSENTVQFAFHPLMKVNKSKMTAMNGRAYKYSAVKGYKYLPGSILIKQIRSPPIPKPSLASFAHFDRLTEDERPIYKRIAQRFIDYTQHLASGDFGAYWLYEPFTRWYEKSIWKAFCKMVLYPNLNILRLMRFTSSIGVDAIDFIGAISYRRMTYETVRSEPLPACMDTWDEDSSRYFSELVRATVVAHETQFPPGGYIRPPRKNEPVKSYLKQLGYETSPSVEGYQWNCAVQVEDSFFEIYSELGGLRDAELCLKLNLNHPDELVFTYGA